MNLPKHSKRLTATSGRAAVFVGLVLAVVPCDGAEKFREYQLGEIAEADVVTPIQFTVTDGERTDRLRQREAQRYPSVFRFNPALGAEAEGQLENAFTNAHALFRAALQQRYGHTALDTGEIEGRRFPVLRNEFRQQFPDFPLTTELAQTWAIGHPGETIRADWAAQLRVTMERPILAATMPQAVKDGPPQVKLISVQPLDTPLDLDAVDRQPSNYPRTNITYLAKAQREAEKMFPLAEPTVARFLARCLVVNCVFDEELTRESHARKTNSIWASEYYQPGQVLVKRGQVVASRVKLALDTLQARLSAQAEAEAAGQISNLQAVAAQLQEQSRRPLPAASAETSDGEDRSLVVRWVVGIVAALGLFGLLVRRRTTTDELVAAPVRRVADASWKRRALAAEQRADHLTGLVRASLMSQFGHWLQHHVWRGWMRQRSDLLGAQRQAEAEVAQLEARLSSLHTPLAERLRAYEQRITELETQLAAKGEENRELLRAKIQMTRDRLHKERLKNRLSWN